MKLGFFWGGDLIHFRWRKPLSICWTADSLSHQLSSINYLSVDSCSVPVFYPVFIIYLQISMLDTNCVSIALLKNYTIIDLVEKPPHSSAKLFFFFLVKNVNIFQNCHVSMKQIYFCNSDLCNFMVNGDGASAIYRVAHYIIQLVSILDLFQFAV